MDDSIPHQEWKIKISYWLASFSGRSVMETKRSLAQREVLKKGNPFERGTVFEYDANHGSRVHNR
jgi:hypothetical protein